MVRNLMIILGLSLSLAAFGCSSDDGNGNGNGGSGGSATGDACLNASDLAIVCDEAFLDSIQICAGLPPMGCAGEPVCTSQCLQDNDGVSTGCADCYGAQVGCVGEFCTLGDDTSCLPPMFGGDFGPGTPECDACTEANCGADFAACAGDLTDACGGAGGNGGNGGSGGSGGSGGMGGEGGRGG